MTAERRIIRLEPNGLAGQGLEPLDLDPSSFQSSLPRQHVHVYFSDPATGVNVGVWDTTSMQEAFGPYPSDEFIVVLEGAFAMIDGQGKGVPAYKGQSVVFRDGIPVSWMQPGYLKKFYMTVFDGKASKPQIDSAEGGVIVLDPNMTLEDGDETTLSDSGAKQGERVLFVNDAGTMTVGLWDTEAMTSEPFPSPSHKLAQILEGSVTITSEDGSSQSFGPGDVLFIPAGTITRWHVPNYLRKYFATVTS